MVEDTKRRKENMKKNNYAVTVKLGHVGRNNYIIKTIAVKAESGKEAAKIARWTGRVKHHAKDAIINVVKINDNQYRTLKNEMMNDPFFHCSNIQEQRSKCINIEKDIQHIDNDINIEERKQKRNERITFASKRKKEEYKECIYTMRNYVELFAY